MSESLDAYNRVANVELGYSSEPSKAQPVNYAPARVHHGILIKTCGDVQLGRRFVDYINLHQSFSITKETLRGTMYHGGDGTSSILALCSSGPGCFLLPGAMSKMLIHPYWYADLKIH
ncbi:hypothetical protein PGT21_005880 [Puccinia graminis f. sp. tritici]|uniref:Uncharacterized protein n=1 Tax=Puccinia graminis f. sp. tritici TaxID=56615 RepID=A0A5B0QMX5_PUCGR|nr:hypothetical protein PGT21_005880 [Puccinia graminis f. sp. tritici]